jgi:excisionase family DNA binding protein
MLMDDFKGLRSRRIGISVDSVMEHETILWGTGIELEVPREALSCMAHGIETLLTTKEASQVLKIHPKVLERMAKRGEVPALKVGKFWRYRATTLDAWINSRLQSGSQACRTATSF